LQELFEFKGRTSLLSALINNLGNEWQSEWQSEIFLEPDNSSLGLCFLWKPSDLQAIKFERLRLPKLQKFNLYENIYERAIARLVKGPVQRGALIGTFNINGKPVRISNIHIDCHGHFSQRAKQLTSLTAYLKSLTPVDREIICGDFNTIGIEILSRNQEKKIRAILGPGFVNAYPYLTPTSNFLQRLDYIFVKNIQVHSAEVLRLKGSDHFPLVASLEV